MAGFQKVTIIGNIGRIETSYTPGGMAVTKFSVATSEKIKGEEVTSWHKLTAFDKRAEAIAKYLDKGSQIHVEGKIQYGKYNKDGIDRYTTDIIVNQFTFVGGKGQNQQQNNQSDCKLNNQYQQGYQNQGQQQNQNQGYQQQQGGYSNTNSGGGYGAPPEDDIPFAMCL